jgi:hypothetical protein
MSSIASINATTADTNRHCKAHIAVRKACWEMGTTVRSAASTAGLEVHIRLNCRFGIHQKKMGGRRYFRVGVRPPINNAATGTSRAIIPSTTSGKPIIDLNALQSAFAILNCDVRDF